MYVTQDPTTKSQPPVNVSYTYPAYEFTETGEIRTIPNKVRLNITRSYDGLRDERTGFNRKIKPCDGDGMLFDSREQAQQYAIHRGYVKEFFRKGGV